MRLDLDWCVGTIRIGGDNFLGPVPGTSYDFVCSVMMKGKEAYLFGAHGVMNRQMYKMIKEKLKAQGVEIITYERLNTEKLRTREIVTT